MRRLPAKSTKKSHARRSIPNRPPPAGHKRPNAPDTPNILEETRKYIRDFDRIAANTKTASELYNQMLAIHPDRVNPAVLWLSARSVKPGS
jgi:hypothetical protein